MKSQLNEDENEIEIDDNIERMIVKSTSSKRNQWYSHDDSNTNKIDFISTSFVPSKKEKEKIDTLNNEANSNQENTDNYKKKVAKQSKEKPMPPKEITKMLSVKAKKKDEFLKYIDTLGSFPENCKQFLMDIIDELYNCPLCGKYIRTTDIVWYCKQCSSFFHFTCVCQNITKETKILSATKKVDKFSFACSYCYQIHNFQSETPPRFRCFCGKKQNNTKYTSVIPFSCGNICNEKITDDHFCTLPCHPGDMHN